MGGGSVFSTYFKFGMDHILEFGAMDHILFVITLCVSFRINDYKKILTLVTAFTIGHSVTLALSSFKIISYPVIITETAIPFTIIITAVLNSIRKTEENRVKTFDRTLWMNYALACVFGMVHGMGFASSFRFLLGTDHILMQLFAFSLGIEAAQLIIVAVFMLCYFGMIKYIKIPQKEFKIFICGAAFGVSVLLLFKVWELI
ncbi:MAG: HupE/UreJ family protein [Bacteroidia bacterium]|nr:HupE/UreJ family protein [Bacteroidia bacterium]